MKNKRKEINGKILAKYKLYSVLEWREYKNVYGIWEGGMGRKSMHEK